MSRHFVVDGYNLLYALPELPPGTWQDKREALLGRLRLEKPQGHNRLTVVFDSREGAGERTVSGELAVIYCAGSADDWMAAFVRETPYPREVVVVTDDQGLRRSVRGTGAKWAPASGFLKKIRPPAGEKPRPPVDRDAITEEMEKEWLP